MPCSPPRSWATRKVHSIKVEGQLRPVELQKAQRAVRLADRWGAEVLSEVAAQLRHSKEPAGQKVEVVVAGFHRDAVLVGRPDLRAEGAEDLRDPDRLVPVAACLLHRVVDPDGPVRLGLALAEPYRPLRVALQRCVSRW